MGNTTVTSNVDQVAAELKRRAKIALEMCGGKAETYAKKLCPVSKGQTIVSNGKTITIPGGTLRRSITHQIEGDFTVVIGTPVKYAPYVEMGHAQTPGRYVPAIGKRLVKSWVNGKPFLAPALADHVDEYNQIFEKVMKGNP